MMATGFKVSSHLKLMRTR